MTADTLATSGISCGAVARRRCLVPADASYEWRPDAAGKHAMRSPGGMGGRMAFAGLWASWRAPDAGRELRGARRAVPGLNIQPTYIVDAPNA